jgi:hypothetical protein
VGDGVVGKGTVGNGDVGEPVVVIGDGDAWQEKETELMTRTPARSHIFRTSSVLNPRDTERDGK